MSPSVRGQHPSPEELDALLDPLDAAPDRRVEDHVGRCGDCRDLLDGMRSVRRLLHEESRRPVSMPPRLQARLEGSIAALSGADGLSGADRPSGTGPPWGSGLTRRRGMPVVEPRDRLSVPRWLSLAAGLVVLAGTGLAASQLLGTDHGNGVADRAGSTSSSAATGDDGASAPGEREGASVSPSGPTSWAPVALPPHGVTATGTSYTAAALPSQVRLLLSASQPEPTGAQQAGPERFGPQPNAADGGSEQAPGDVAAWLADPTSLGRCVAALGAPDRRPLAVDVGSWEGRPAAVVVVPEGNGHALASVVEAPCAGPTDVLYRMPVER